MIKIKGLELESFKKEDFDFEVEEKDLSRLDKLCEKIFPVLWKEVKDIASENIDEIWETYCNQDGAEKIGEKNLKLKFREIWEFSYGSYKEDGCFYFSSEFKKDVAEFLVGWVKTELAYCDDFASKLEELEDWVVREDYEEWEYSYKTDIFDFLKEYEIGFFGWNHKFECYSDYEARLGKARSELREAVDACGLPDCEDEL